MEKVKVVNHSSNALPEYQTVMSAGLDLRAHLDAPVEIASLDRVLIGTGLHIALPEGYEAQIRPRSGMAWKHGLTVLNTPGTIDADYRGEIKVVLINLSKEKFTVQNGDRIAQMVLNKYEQIDWVISENLDDTERGSGGYGHTGKE